MDTQQDVITSASQNLLPTTLNVLTILTFIGCGLGLIGAIYTYITIGFSYDTLTNMDLSDTENMPGFVQGLMNASVEIVRKQYENRHLLFAASMVSLLLCFVGALQMRKLRKQGFIIYTIGELMLPIINAILIGIKGTAGIGMLFGLVIAVVFVVLYASQRKHMVN